jgi:hypothetical protein
VAHLPCRDPSDAPVRCDCTCGTEFHKSKKRYPAIIRVMQGTLISGQCYVLQRPPVASKCKVARVTTCLMANALRSAHSNCSVPSSSSQLRSICRQQRRYHRLFRFLENYCLLCCAPIREKTDVLWMRFSQDLTDGGARNGKH